MVMRSVSTAILNVYPFMQLPKEQFPCGLLPRPTMWLVDIRKILYTVPMRTRNWFPFGSSLDVVETEPSASAPSRLTLQKIMFVVPRDGTAYTRHTEIAFHLYKVPMRTENLFSFGSSLNGVGMEPSSSAPSQLTLQEAVFVVRIDETTQT